MSISVFLFAISREALAVNRYNDEQMESNDSWQNKKYADQNLSILTIDNVILSWLVMELTSHKPNYKLGQGSLLTCRSDNLQAGIYIFCLSMPE